MMGTRPIVEMRFSDFALCAIDELVNQAAKARFMFGGQAKVPLVVREPIGMWRSSAAQHSQSLESWYAHIPGLVVVCPATPADNYGLMKTAIRNDDPVVYMEHKNLWGLEGDLDDPPAPIPFGRARVARTGTDATIVAWSACVHAALDAATELAQEGRQVEVIDLRCLWPWDRDTVLTSARKTGRVLIAHEAVRVGGFGAEIAAVVAEEAHGALKAPVRRLGSPRAPIAYAPPLEDLLRVTPAHIARAVRGLFA
jgi:pyruvate dehydrogenase E1 component beta subunit